MAITYTYNPPENDGTTVKVTFTSDSPSFTHIREVNAAFDGPTYDPDATEITVSEVALGVEHKIKAGAIVNENVVTDESEDEVDPSEGE